MFSGTDLVALGKNRKQIEVAHDMKKQARAFVDALGLNLVDHEDILGAFDVKLCCYVTKKVEPGTQPAQSFAELGGSFLESLEMHSLSHFFLTSVLSRMTLGTELSI